MRVSVHTVLGVLWSGKNETNYTTNKQTVILVIKRVPINKHLVVEIPNNSSLLGATTVSAMATSATKNPPY